MQLKQQTFFDNVLNRAEVGKSNAIHMQSSIHDLNTSQLHPKTYITPQISAMWLGKLFFMAQCLHAQDSAHSSKSSMITET